MLYASSSQISGAGTINTSGIIGDDFNLALNASQGTNQSFAVNGVTVNLNQSGSNALGVGYIGTGTLNISGGVTVSNSNGYLGYNVVSTGTATVTGTGTKWANSAAFMSATPARVR